jgi:hypothetical protein
MRVFLGLLFLGSGDTSVRAAHLLEERLREGISLSGGLQQSSQGMPEDRDERARGEADLEDIVRDIAAALLGREITFGAATPYPPDHAPLQAYDDRYQASLGIDQER